MVDLLVAWLAVLLADEKVPMKVASKVVARAASWVVGRAGKWVGHWVVERAGR